MLPTVNGVIRVSQGSVFALSSSVFRQAQYLLLSV